MLEGINKLIFDSIVPIMKPYFWDKKTAIVEVNKLLSLPYKEYTKRQELAENIIKFQLAYHGKDIVHDHITELAMVESAHMTLDVHLRDHIVHSVLTFLLGIYIKSKWKWLDELDNYYDDFYFRWKMCAPLHDIGYPLEIYDHSSENTNNLITKSKEDFQLRLKGKIKEPPRKFKRVKGKAKCNDYIKDYNKLYDNETALDLMYKRLKRLKIKLDPYDYFQWLKDNKIPDHGAVSSVLTLHMFDFIYGNINKERVRHYYPFEKRNYDQRIFEEDIVNVTSAIFIHNIHVDYLEKNPFKINFKKAPLHCLLCICDRLQEWERPKLIEVNDKKEYIAHSPELFDIKEDIDIENSNGGVTLFINPIINASIQISTTNGGITVEGDFITETDSTYNSFSGILGSGGNSINIITVNGGIKIEELVV